MRVKKDRIVLEALLKNEIVDDVFFAVLENGHKLKVKATERQREVLGSPESRQSETPVLIGV